ncbi:Transposase [Roseovarius gaetbuli]|uniref:Transposase n=1 Tax=Roseovarius gaetbuli TaxID=1356575 RepID=A0A1X7AD09_9RHOB|nr:Transposase [Roseovarius gaetbuli]
MTKKPQTSKEAAEKVVKNIRRKTRQTYSAGEKIRIVLAGLRGEESISVLCRHEGIAERLYYSWSKEFLEAGKRRLSGDTARQATNDHLTWHEVETGSCLMPKLFGLVRSFVGRTLHKCKRPVWPLYGAFFHGSRSSTRLIL